MPDGPRMKVMAGWPTALGYAQKGVLGRSGSRRNLLLVTSGRSYTSHIMEPPSLASLFIDLATIAGLIVLASFFVAAEIALISLRDSQVRQIASRGKRGARVAALAEHPNRLLPLFKLA